MLSRFPIPAGTSDYELVLPHLVDVTLIAEGTKPPGVAFRWADEVGFIDLPAYAIRDLGEGRFRAPMPAGRVDLRITMPEGEPILVEGVAIDASGATEVIVPL